MGRTVTSDPNVIALPASPTGFTAGDYVYQSRTGYGSIPAGALSTGNFDVGSLPTPVYGSTATTSNELVYVEQFGGSMGSQVAAQLTNGNIVYVYGTSDTTTYTNPATVNFRIETTAGASVVAQTSTTMTLQGPFQASVVALPAGGFCIVASVPNGSNYSISARFYNADGTAATAVLAAGLSIGGVQSTSLLKLQAFSDGSVILGYVSTGDIWTIRRVTTAGFDATFGTSGTISPHTDSRATQWWDFIVDGSNNIHTIAATSTSNANIRRYNSAGVLQTSSSALTTNIRAVAIVRTSDNVIRGIVQDQSGIIVYNWDGTTVTLGPRIVTSVGTTPEFGALGAFAQGASGGYVVFYNSNVLASAVSATSAACINLQAFSSSNTSLAAATRVNSAIAVNYRNQFVPIVVSGNTRVYFGVFQANSVNLTFGTSNSMPMGVAYFAYNNTTFALVGTSTANYDWGSQGPFALGAYMRSVSTAAVARFTIASTGNYPVSVANGTTVIAKTLIDGANSSQRVSLCPLPNGEFVAVWARNTGATFISKYSAAGALQVGPVTVSATGTGNSYQAASVATFANGNILVTYMDTTTTTLRFRIYTPSLTVVTSGDIDTAYTPNNPYTSCTSFGDGDHVAVMFCDTSGIQRVRCVRSTGTVTGLIGPGLNVTSSWFQSQVIGFKSNSFAIVSFANDGSTGVYGYIVRKTGANSFLAGVQVNIGSSFTNISGAPTPGSPIPSPGTAAYFIAGGASSNAYRIVSINPLMNTGGQLPISETAGLLSGYSIGSNCGATIGYTANGTPVLVANRGNTQFLTLAPFSPPMNGNQLGNNTNTSSGGITTTLATASATNYVSAIPHIGDAILIGYTDDSGRLSFTSINVAPFTVNATLTAGVDISTSTLSLTPEAGYSLQGIATTGASSGSSGLVQTRGVATLNSNYSAATPATTFDFRNPLTFGTFGTIIGRSVIMGY